MNSLEKNPLNMQYLGSKARISKWILKNIKTYFPDTLTFVDLFAGTGSVSIQANYEGLKIIANDIQPYSKYILDSLFVESRTGISKLINSVSEYRSIEKLFTSGRDKYSYLYNEEIKKFQESKRENWDWESYKEFCDSTILLGGNFDEIMELKNKQEWTLFINYYSNTYFGVKQCFQLDAIRELAENQGDNNLKTILIAATISAMTYAVSGTTHLAQFLKPSAEKTSINLIKRRSVDIIDLVIQRLIDLKSFPLPKQKARVFNEDYKKVLSIMKRNKETTFYIDPPYFKEHYSRYYHVLDTFVLYDFPELSINPVTKKTSIGRYRKERISSDFGLKSKVENAFCDLFSQISSLDGNLILSYSDHSLLDKDRILILASLFNYKGEVLEKKILHSGQGRPHNRQVIEYLFIFSK